MGQSTIDRDYGLQIMYYRLWDYGWTRTMDYRLGTIDYGLWSTDYGQQTMGLWTIDYDLQTVNYGLL